MSEEEPPKIDLDGIFYATIDDKLMQVRITNGKDVIISIPYAKIDELCDKII